MQLTKGKLIQMNNERKFKQVVHAYEAQQVNTKDADVLFQVALAYLMCSNYDAATTVSVHLPKEMEHDFKRDILFAQIRSKEPTPNARQSAHELMSEANTNDRQHLAEMALARALRKEGRSAEAKSVISYAFSGIAESSDETYRRNVAFWYLVIDGGAKYRHTAWTLSRRDPSAKRRLIALICRSLPFAGKLPPLKTMY